MKRLTVDLSEAQSFEPVEPGPYGMTVDAFDEPEPSKEKGTLGMFAYFKFDRPDLAQKAGRVRRWYAVQGKGSGFFRELWKAATGEDLPIGQAIDVDLDQAIGRHVVVDVGNEDYEGRTQNTVRKVAAAE